MNSDQITVRLGEDFNWWVDRNSEEAEKPQEQCGILDPRQVRHIFQALEQYQSYGLPLSSLAKAFQMFEVDAEISEGCLRLARSEATFSADGPNLFALPITGQEENSPYYDFLGAVSEARIHYLNKTHHFACDCSVEEMERELAVLDSDRYFCAEAMHVFDEINEILEWSPAEWDNTESSL